MTRGGTRPDDGQPPKQVARAQLTPRIITITLLRDPVVRSTVGMFVYSLLLAVAVKARPEEIPNFLARPLGIMAFVCLIAFLTFIDYTARLMRPVSIVWRIAEKGQKVINAVYPDRHGNPVAPERPAQPITPVERSVRHRGNSGIVLA